MKKTLILLFVLIVAAPLATPALAKTHKHKKHRHKHHHAAHSEPVTGR